MKKIHLYILSIIVLCILFVFLLTSCNRALDTPTNLCLHENEILTWNEVKGASQYEVNINSKTLYTESNNIDLFYEFDDSCEYIIDVRAIGTNNKSSSYSEPVTYKIPQINLEMLKIEPMKNGYLYIKGSKKDLKGKVAFPNTIDGKKYYLATKCFQNFEGLTGLIFEDEITSIPDDAFSGAKNLRFINMKKVEYIYPFAFKDCSRLEKIIFSDDLKEISEYAFKNCTALKSLHFPASFTRISGSAIAGCDNIEEITVDANNTYEVINNCLINKEKGSVILGCNSSVIPTDENITRIDHYAFTNTDFEKVIIPENITEIGQFAFYNNLKLKEVVLHDNITLIDQGAFSFCFNLEIVKTPKKIEKMYGFQLSKIPILIFEDTLINKDAGDAFSAYIFNYEYYFYEKVLNENETAKSGVVYGCDLIEENGEYYINSIQKPRSMIEKIIIPQRKGYKFLGWSFSQNKEDIVTTIINVELSYSVYFSGLKIYDEKGKPISIQVTEFDSSIDYSNIDRLYAIWEKE